MLHESELIHAWAIEKLALFDQFPFSPRVNKSKGMFVYREKKREKYLQQISGYYFINKIQTIAEN